MTWQYHVCTYLLQLDESSTQKVQTEINDLGKKGWELVATVPFIIDGNSGGGTLIFKRPR
jgi:hypothetical protein